MAWLKGLLSGALLIFNTIFWSPPLFVLALIKWVVPIEFVRRTCETWMVMIAEAWITFNGYNIALTQNIAWDVDGLDGLSRDESYVVIANHQSWLDIVAIQKVMNRKIPFLRFFIKQELIYVPLLGLAWWALDFPRMRRFSKEALAERPELRGKDLVATRKSLGRLGERPFGVLNFVEGTRYSPAKSARQASPYKHLLAPKAGGLINALQTMGGRVDGLLDVTIYYPDGPVSLLAALSGNLKQVVVRVQREPVPEWVLQGDYDADPEFRKKFQLWLAEIWRRKDDLLGQLRVSPSAPPRG